MTTSVSLRRSLRNIPEFRLLSRRNLDAIIDRMNYREYKSGDVLWRTGTRLDFLGIIQKGEIIVERRINGSVIRSVKLSAGDFVWPRDLKGKDNHSTVLARAVTDVRFCFLHMKEIDILQSKSLDSNVPIQSYIQRVSWRKLWVAIVVILIAFLIWQDMSRVLSGVLYLVSNQTKQPAYDYQRSMRLLNYAESLDRSAAFAYNQEGYLWIQHNDSQRAEIAFLKALVIDPNNGAAFNNLAVAYFTTGQFQQTVILQQKAVQNNPDNAVVRYNMGLVLMKQNYNIEALREFKEASYIDSTWALPYIQQGFIYVQMQDYVNAEQAVSVAVRLDPTQQSAHLILAIALYNQGKNQEALKSVENALRIDANDNVSRFYEALILGNLGEFDTALLILQQLLESSSDPQQISRIKAEIEFLRRSLPNPLSEVN